MFFADEVYGESSRYVIKNKFYQPFDSVALSFGSFLLGVVASKIALCISKNIKTRSKIFIDSQSRNDGRETHYDEIDDIELQTSSNVFLPGERIPTQKEFIPMSGAMAIGQMEHTIGNRMQNNSVSIRTWRVESEIIQSR